MAIVKARLSPAYRGLSTDTKPTKPAHLLFYETNTSSWFVYNGSAWVAFSGFSAGPS